MASRGPSPGPPGPIMNTSVPSIVPGGSYAAIHGSSGSQMHTLGTTDTDVSRRPMQTAAATTASTMPPILPAMLPPSVMPPMGLPMLLGSSLAPSVFQNPAMRPGRTLVQDPTRVAVEAFVDETLGGIPVSCLGIALRSGGAVVTDKEVEKIAMESQVRGLATDGRMMVPVDTVLQLVRDLQVDARSDFDAAFQVLDEGRLGGLPPEEVIKILSAPGSGLSVAEAREVVADCCPGDRLISAAQLLATLYPDEPVAYM